MALSLEEKLEKKQAEVKQLKKEIQKKKRAEIAKRKAEEKEQRIKMKCMAIDAVFAKDEDDLLMKFVEDNEYWRTTIKQYYSEQKNTVEDVQQSDENSQRRIQGWDV